jgi:hypothetical protein
MSMVWRRYWWVALLSVVALVVVLRLGLPRVSVTSKMEAFEIPNGTWARRMSGDKVDILPDFVRLTLGVRDVLVLKNLDDVPQIFGPTLMMPGQSFQLPFGEAASYQFACTAHSSGQMTVIVDPYPESVMARLVWRGREFLRYLRQEPKQEDK